MHLYKEASVVLQKIQEKKGTVKNVVLSSKYKNKKLLFALVCETLKYKAVLATILENTKLLRLEKILKPEYLAHVLVYDFLLGKTFSGHNDKFKDAILRHKAALQSELVRMKVKAGASKNEDLLPNEVKNAVVLPRYVRINTLKRSIPEVIEHFKKDDFVHSHLRLSSYESYIEMVAALKKNQFVQDPYIEELLVFGPGTDLHSHVLYTTGDIIFQDKASCIPAHVLAPPPGSHVIDCCAAPGNKTSQLAAIMKNTGKLFAFDKDMKRASMLNTMLLRAGVLCTTTRQADFLRVDPQDPLYKDVEYILVDPSCSGSGIMNRLDKLTNDEESTSNGRIENLAKFQLSILCHALSFPSVKKVVYSTCSVHQSENEGVVSKALSQTKDNFKLVTAMKHFPNRGQKFEKSDERFSAKKCVRLDPASDLCNGFFVALFERKLLGDEGIVEYKKTLHESGSNICKKTTENCQHIEEDSFEPVKSVGIEQNEKKPAKSKRDSRKRKSEAYTCWVQQGISIAENETKCTNVQEKVIKTTVAQQKQTAAPQQKQAKNKKKHKNRKHKPITI